MRELSAAQQQTHESYSNRELVQGFQERNAHSPRVEQILRSFAASLPGRGVIDIGCGPGRDAGGFASLGYMVTAIDYSSEMIRAAIESTPAGLEIDFRVLDMRLLAEEFASNSFDGAWIAASLLHIPELEVPNVLSALHHILVPGGRIALMVKEGVQGARLVRDSGYGIEIAREFIFWESENLERELLQSRFRIDQITRYQSERPGFEPSSWLEVEATVDKPSL